jgi:hypothetical protein
MDRESYLPRRQLRKLENSPVSVFPDCKVICRVGSLEIVDVDALIKVLVICRVGSLENS